MQNQVLQIFSAICSSHDGPYWSHASEMRWDEMTSSFHWKTERDERLAAQRMRDISTQFNVQDKSKTLNIVLWTSERHRVLCRTPMHACSQSAFPYHWAKFFNIQYKDKFETVSMHIICFTLCYMGLCSALLEYQWTRTILIFMSNALH